MRTPDLRSCRLAAFVGALLVAAACSHDNTAPAVTATLAFTTPPASAAAGTPIPAIVVTAEDATGSAMPSFSGAITLALASNPDSATLAGTLTENAVNGVATFTDISLDRADSGYTIAATSRSAHAATSPAFTVAVGDAQVFIAAGGDAQNGAVSATLPTRLSVLVTDRDHNKVTGYVVTWTVASGHGKLAAATSVTDARGVATNTWVLGSVPGVQTVSAGQPFGAGTPATFSANATPLPFIALTAGRYHTCALNTVHDAYCWGYNLAGQFGDGTTNDSNTSTATLFGMTFDSLTAGPYDSCGLAQGIAYCWGDNSYGASGYGTVGNGSSTPIAVVGGLTFASLSAGPDGADGNHTCGLTPAGAAYCWGNNAFGAIGDSTTTPRYAPTAVWGGLTFTSLRSSRNSTCALVAGGAMYCWGDNTYGEIGDSTTTRRYSPTRVAGGLAFTSFATQTVGVTTCALTASGAAYCWGYNDLGGVGDGTTTDRDAPTPVAGNLTFSVISAGAFHTCGLTLSGAAYCWGDNSYGALGDGTNTQRLTPTLVAGNLSFTTIVAGVYHTCALTADGSAYCWGNNLLGELGDGTRVNRNVPTAIAPTLAGSAALRRPVLARRSKR